MASLSHTSFHLGDFIVLGFETLIQVGRLFLGNFKAITKLLNSFWCLEPWPSSFVVSFLLIQLDEV